MFIELAPNRGLPKVLLSVAFQNKVSQKDGKINDGGQFENVENPRNNRKIILFLLMPFFRVLVIQFKCSLTEAKQGLAVANHGSLLGRVLGAALAGCLRDKDSHCCSTVLSVCQVN